MTLASVTAQAASAVVRGVGAAANSSTVLLVSPDNFLRERLRRQLATMRWTVMEAAGGAEAMLLLDTHSAAAVLLDGWLPDLEATEFARILRMQFPNMDLLYLDGTIAAGTPKAVRRHELLHALREVQDDVAGDGPAWNAAPDRIPPLMPRPALFPSAHTDDRAVSAMAQSGADTTRTASRLPQTDPVFALPELIGDTPALRELASMIRLVAPRPTTVLIEGETGTGKELVAKAVHRLSDRAGKPFVVLNCAAIPEHLLEAELFGHTRGAFTGAVTSRTGRIEAAHGGTLFLDEIGEMPLALQAKMLRFLETGEIQKIGENEMSRVDVRIVAATHQPLQQRSAQGQFRLDLYHRLAVFPVEIPALRDRAEDLPMLVNYLLRRLAERMPVRRITADAMSALQQHLWPGNVRELGHVLERAAILTGDSPEIAAEHIRIRSAVR